MFNVHDLRTPPGQISSSWQGRRDGDFPERAAATSAVTNLLVDPPEVDDIDTPSKWEKERRGGKR